MNGRDSRCTESLILPREQVYAIGEFSTIGGENTDLTFLISNVNSGKLALRYRIWAWLHLVVMIGAVAGAAFFAMK